MNQVYGSRKLIAFLFTLGCITALRGMGDLSDEAFMVVASGALGGFFTANVMAGRKPQAGSESKIG